MFWVVNLSKWPHTVLLSSYRAGYVTDNDPNTNIKNPKQKNTKNPKKTKTKNEKIRTKKGLSTNEFRHAKWILSVK